MGDDILGRFLRETLVENNVDTSSMLFTKETRTGVVFVTLSENGQRSFDFYIQLSADQMLKDTEIEENLFTKNKILHLSSISMINETARLATSTKGAMTALPKLSDIEAILNNDN